MKRWGPLSPSFPAFLLETWLSHDVVHQEFMGTAEAGAPTLTGYVPELEPGFCVQDRKLWGLEKDRTAPPPRHIHTALSLTSWTRLLYGLIYL